MPSAASGPEKSSSLSARISANAVLNGIAGTRLRIRLVSATALGAPASTPSQRRATVAGTSSVTAGFPRIVMRRELGGDRARGLAG